MTEVEKLMCEYFEVKDKEAAVRSERNQFMEDEYDCENMRSGFQMPPSTCIEWNRDTAGAWNDLCDPCLKRHAFYLERKKLSTRRSALLSKVRRRVKRQLTIAL